VADSPKDPGIGTPRADLDAARSRLHPAARETLLAALDAGWADPRRLHREGRQARLLLDRAREVLADGIGVRPDELRLLPSGPEALVTGMVALAHGRRRHGTGLVCSAVDQATVLLRARSSAPVDAQGRVDADALAALAAEPAKPADSVEPAGHGTDTGRSAALVVLQDGNGEVGTTQPVDSVRSALEPLGIPLLVDASSSLGRTAPPTPFDALAGDASSFGGPAALGLLAVRTGTRCALPAPRREPERGLAEADPWVPLALAAAEAWQQVAAAHAAEEAAARALVDDLRAAAAAVPDVEVVGDPAARLPHVVTFSVLYVDGETLVDELDRRGFAVASGSACTSSRLEPSHVLAAMGALTHGNVRITLPLQAVSPDRATHVARLIAQLPDAIAAVRARLGTAGL
jgi:cysteine desulfurase